MTVEAVEKLMDDSAEAQAQQQRMHDALCGSLTPEQDAAAAKELAELEATAEAEEAAALDLPSVPKTEVTAPQQEVKMPPQPQAEEPIAA